LYNIRYDSTSNWNNNNVHTRRCSSHTIIARIKKSNFTTAEQHLKTQLSKHNTIIVHLDAFFYVSHQFIFLKMKPTRVYVVVTLNYTFEIDAHEMHIIIVCCMYIGQWTCTSFFLDQTETTIIRVIVLLILILNRK